MAANADGRDEQAAARDGVRVVGGLVALGQALVDQVPDLVEVDVVGVAEADDLGRIGDAHVAVGIFECLDHFGS